jgi:hypothetical protein
MSEQLRLRGDTAANVAAYTGPQRETVVDITNNRLVVQDGVTPGGWAAAKLTEVSKVARTSIVSSYSASATDRLIAVVSIVSPIYVSLPAAASFQAGARLLIIDESGASSFTKPIFATPQGTDVVVGVYSSTIATPYGFLELESNGIGQWTMSDGSNSSSSGAAQTISAASRSTSAAFSGQAIIGLSQPITPFSIAEPRLNAAMRPVISPLNPYSLKNGVIIGVTLTAFAVGKFDALAIVTTLDGRIAPSQMAYSLLTLNYIGA